MPMNLKQIDAKLGELRGVVANVGDRVQELAVAIIAHAAGAGAGDVSRALTLVQALPNSFRREYLLQYLKYFGSIGIDLKGGKVRVLSRDNKAYRGFDVDGAKANRWDEPFEADGVTRKPWYQGPNPQAFESSTIGDFGMNVVNFGDRLAKQLDATKPRFPGSTDEVPVYALTPEQREQANAAISTLKRLGLSIAAGEEITNLDERRKMLEETAAVGPKIVKAATA